MSETGEHSRSSIPLRTPSMVSMTPEQAEAERLARKARVADATHSTTRPQVEGVKSTGSLTVKKGGR